MLGRTMMFAGLLMTGIACPLAAQDWKLQLPDWIREVMHATEALLKTPAAETPPAAPPTDASGLPQEDSLERADAFATETDRPERETEAPNESTTRKSNDGEFRDALARSRRDLELQGRMLEELRQLHQKIDQLESAAQQSAPASAPSASFCPPATEHGGQYYCPQASPCNYCPAPRPRLLLGRFRRR